MVKVELSLDDIATLYCCTLAHIWDDKIPYSVEVEKWNMLLADYYNTEVKNTENGIKIC
jgi:hypothetical protein